MTMMVGAGGAESATIGTTVIAPTAIAIAITTVIATATATGAEEVTGTGRGGAGAATRSQRIDDMAAEIGRRSRQPPVARPLLHGRTADGSDVTRRSEASDGRAS